DPVRDRCVPRAHLGQPAAGRGGCAAPPPVKLRPDTRHRSEQANMLEAGADAMGVQPHRALPIWRVALGVAALAALIVLGRRAVGAEVRKIVFLLRLSPVFPFNLLNYALGLTRVRFADFFLASVGMLPGTVLYVYSGKLIGDVTALAGGAAVEKGAAYYAVLVLGLAATVAVTTVVTRTAQRALRDATGA